MTNRKELFEKTLTTLIEAWEGGELQHKDCTRCAVGNICGGKREWAQIFCTNPRQRQERFSKSESVNWSMMIGYGREHAISLYDQGKNLIKASGYSEDELARVEYAFESSIAHDYDRLSQTSEGQYLGLCAVIDVLTDIHGIEAPGQKTDINRVATTKGVTALQPA